MFLAVRPWQTFVRHSLTYELQAVVFANRGCILYSGGRHLAKETTSLRQEPLCHRYQRGLESAFSAFRVRSMIKTFDEAYQFVLSQKVCTVFGSKGSPHPSLWDNTELSEEKPTAGGWSPKVVAVWDWKTRIPQTYPETVFYGKVSGGMQC